MNKDTAPLKDAIKNIISKLEKGAKKDSELISIWERVVGRDISKHTKPRSLKSGRLVVNVSDSSRLYELTLKRQELIKAINRQLKEKKTHTGQTRGEGPKGKTRGQSQTIKEIRFKIGEI